MAGSSTDSGFFAYYREYAQSGIHAASAAALTLLIGLANFVNWWFLVLGIAVYVLPPVFLYLTAEGENVPSVDREENHDDETSADEYESEHDNSAPESDFDSSSETDFMADDTDEPDSDTADTESGWTETDTPTEEALLDVVSTQNGAYAVGDSGIVLTRDTDGWEIALEHGPTAESNTLRGVDTTEDGSTVWFAGDGGVLGHYENGKITDHSAPEDQTSTWTDVAVTGKTDAEQIHLVNGSGELLRGEYEDGAVSWNDIEKPGSGSSISSIEFVDSDRGYICDTNQGVFETTDGGKNWGEIGIEDANTAFTGIAATDSVVVVAGDDGSVFRYDGSVWTRLHAGSALSAIGLVGETGLAVGDGGAVYELTDGSWESVETPVDADLRGVAISADGEQAYPAVVVGADGTVIERHR